MSSMDMGQLTYLLILGAALVGWLLLQGRSRIGRMLQQAAAWGLIFVGVVAAIGMWDDIRTTVQPQAASSVVTGDSIEVPRGYDGHYHLTLEVNGVPIPFMVDTGASTVVLTQADAARVGLHPENLNFYDRANTANGQIATAPVRLDSIGPFGDRNFRAWVNGGEMQTSLLGMSYLQRFSEVRIAEGKMVLVR